MVNSMNAGNQTGGAGRRRGFTLIELLVTITVYDHSLWLVSKSNPIPPVQ